VKETPFDWRVDRLCDGLLTVLRRYEPTAAELVQEGMGVEEALRTADRNELRVRRLLRESDASLRDSGLL